MKLIFFFITILSIQTTWSKTLFFSGKIIDSSNNIIIAALFSQGDIILTTSNENGYFEFQTSDTTSIIKISHLSYQTKFISCSELKNTKTVTLCFLVHDIKPIAISYQSPLSIMSKALKKQKQNNENRKRVEVIKYNSYSTINDTPNFFNKSIYSLYTEEQLLSIKIDTTIVVKQTYKLNPNDSFMFFSIPDFYFDFIYDVNKVIQINKLASYTFSFSKSFWSEDGKRIFVINFSNNSRKQKGSFTIEDSTYVILSFSENTISNKMKLVTNVNKKDFSYIYNINQSYTVFLEKNANDKIDFSRMYGRIYCNDKYNHVLVNVFNANKVQTSFDFPKKITHNNLFDSIIKNSVEINNLSQINFFNKEEMEIINYILKR